MNLVHGQYGNYGVETKWYDFAVPIIGIYRHWLSPEAQEEEQQAKQATQEQLALLTAECERRERQKNIGAYIFLGVSGLLLLTAGGFLFARRRRKK